MPLLMKNHRKWEAAWAECLVWEECPVWAACPAWAECPAWAVCPAWAAFRGWVACQALEAERRNQHPNLPPRLMTLIKQCKDFDLKAMYYVRTKGLMSCIRTSCLYRFVFNHIDCGSRASLFPLHHSRKLSIPYQTGLKSQRNAPRSDILLFQIRIN